MVDLRSRRPPKFRRSEGPGGKGEPSTSQRLPASGDHGGATTVQYGSIYIYICIGRERERETSTTTSTTSTSTVIAESTRPFQKTVSVLQPDRSSPKPSGPWGRHGVCMDVLHGGLGVSVLPLPKPGNLKSQKESSECWHQEAPCAKGLLGGTGSPHNTSTAFHIHPKTGGRKHMHGHSIACG